MARSRLETGYPGPFESSDLDATFGRLLGGGRATLLDGEQGCNDSESPEREGRTEKAVPDGGIVVREADDVASRADRHGLDQGICGQDGGRAAVDRCVPIPLVDAANED